jgi:hypothetical protein
MSLHERGSQELRTLRIVAAWLLLGAVAALAITALVAVSLTRTSGNARAPQRYSPRLRPGLSSSRALDVSQMTQALRAAGRWPVSPLTPPWPRSAVLGKLSPRNRSPRPRRGTARRTSGAAWCGHYIATDTASGGQPITSDWYFTPCGDGCANVSIGTTGTSQARLVNNQWTLDTDHTTVCPDGSKVSRAGPPTTRGIQIPSQAQTKSPKRLQPAALRRRNHGPTTSNSGRPRRRNRHLKSNGRCALLDRLLG